MKMLRMQTLEGVRTLERNKWGIREPRVEQVASLDDGASLVCCCLSARGPETSLSRGHFPAAQPRTNDYRHWT